MDARKALLLVGMLIGCSKHDPAPPGSADGGAPAAAMTPVPSASAVSPFSADGAALDVDAERFPSKLVALAWETRVMEQPAAGSKMLGYLRAGAVVAAAKQGAKGDGCRGEWRPIAPTGYVCVEGGNATLDLDTTMARALATRPDTSARLPYMYGIVRRPGPIYARLPTRAEAEAAEPGLDARMKAWLAEGGEDGASFRSDYWQRGKSEAPPAPQPLWDQQTTREVPDWLAGGKFPPGNLSTLRHGDDLVVGTATHHNGFALVDT
ncbi:MAG: hypothetical protein ACRELB_07105, partial [Polyangiaceae bacterium]